MDKIFNRKVKASLYLTVLLLFAVAVRAQEIPPKPVPAKFVNDFAKILTDDQAYSIENKLKAFGDTTTTQIVVVTVTSLQGTTSNDFAQKLGQKWGIGNKENNNGVVLLIKPKTEDELGDCAIQAGYGVEEYLPDAICHRIIYNVMIPAFKENNYYKGINNACDDMIGLLTGKFTPDNYGDEWDEDATMGLIMLIMAVGLFIFISILRKGNIGGGAISRGYTSYGGGSGGSGGSSFGGGSFGGGGASGKW